MSVQLQPNIIQLTPAGHSWPQVSFDIALGSRVSNIEFDIEAYGNYLRERELDDAAIADTKLHFAKTYNPLKTGNYDEKDTKELTVNLTPLVSEQSANEIIYHETEHLIDDKNGVLKGESLTLAKAGIVAEIGAVSILTTTSNIEALYVAAALNVLGGVSMLGNILAYRLSRQERVARSVGKLHRDATLVQWQLR